MRHCTRRTCYAAYLVIPTSTTGLVSGRSMSSDIGRCNKLLDACHAKRDRPSEDFPCSDLEELFRTR